MGSYLLGNFTAALSADSCGIFSGGVLMAPELQPQELEYQGDNGGIYCQDSMQRVFNSAELQVVYISHKIFELLPLLKFFCVMSYGWKLTAISPTVSTIKQYQG